MQPVDRFPRPGLAREAWRRRRLTAREHARPALSLGTAPRARRRGGARALPRLRPRAALDRTPSRRARRAARPRPPSSRAARRPDAARASHHRALVDTETVAAARFTARLGLRGRVDFLVPSFVLRRAAALRLLTRSRARGSTMYGEWVALLAGLGDPLTYVECDGLDWETPDRHRAEVRRVGLAAWRRAMSSPAEWAMRRAMAQEFRRGFERALGRWPVVGGGAVRRPK